MTQRRYILQIFKDFIASISPRQIWGDKVGRDHLGTIYYEIKKSGGRRSTRWYSHPDQEPTDHNIPPEWQSWLRHTRKDPPTDEEIQINKIKMQAAVEGARKLDMQYKKTLGKADHKIHEGPKYPTYADLERVPVKGSQTK